MTTWGGNIVIAEPAPALAGPARYLAFKADAREVLAAGPLVLIGLVIAGVIVYGAGCGAVAEIAAALFGKNVHTPVWVGSGLIVTLLIVIAYVLVARYGLRFPKEFEADPSEAQILTARGNTAWRCLPEPQRAENVARLRAMNAAARLALVDPGDTEAMAVLRENCGHLHQLTLTSLPENR